MTILAYAIFDTHKGAANAVDALVESDFTMKDIKSGVGPGMAIGAALGVVGGALVALGGGLLAAGPLVGLLEGAVGGGAAGLFTGFVGGLGHMHETIDFPHHHHKKIEHGAVLVGVMTTQRERIEAAKKALVGVGAEEVHVRTRRQADAELERKHV